jgi:hypothetical protein
MDFSELKRLPLGDAVNAVVSEGGATVGGFIGAGALGRRFQAALGSTDSAIVTTMDGLKAAAYNNGPKIAAWYILRGKNLFGGATPDVEKGIVTNVAFDLLMRALNKGVNPATATIFGYQAMGEGNSGAGSGNVSATDVQALIQKNAALEAEVGRLRGAGPVLNPDARQRKYKFMPGTSSAGEPGAPLTPGVRARQKRYGFAGEQSAAGVASKPGAANIQAGKMFNMA